MTIIHKTEQLKWCLILSYFDEIKGPKIFYCKNLLSSIKQADLEKILDVLDYNIGEETYIFAFRKHQIINYLFCINSKFARGGQDLIMISYVIEPSYFRKKFIDEFRYLESKKKILKEYAKKLKSFYQLPNILHNQNDILGNDPINSIEFWNKFKELYNKYYEILTPKFIDEFEKWIYIKPQCPICNEKKAIEIPERIINVNKNLTNITIPRYKICQHAFMVSVDKNFKIYESENIDFDLISFEQPNKLKLFNINIFKIKSNIKPALLVNILYALLHGKKVLLLFRKSTEFNKDLFDFFQYIFQDSFKINITIRNKKEFKKEKKNYKNYIVLTKYSFRKYMNTSKINIFKFEKEIIENFYKKNDPITCIIYLKNKIQEIYGLSQKLSEMNKRFGYIQRKQAITYLEDTYFLRIKKDFFYFLLGIVKNYFAIDIKLTQDILAKKIDEMWGIR